MNLFSLTLPAQVPREFLYIFFIITSLFISNSRIKQRQMTWAAHSLDDDDDVTSVASLKLKIIQLAAGFCDKVRQQQTKWKIAVSSALPLYIHTNFRFFCTHFHLHVQPIRIADCMCACARMIAESGNSDIWLVRSIIIYSKNI